MKYRVPKEWGKADVEVKKCNVKRTNVQKLQPRLKDRREGKKGKT